MKISCAVKEITCTQSKLAQALEISQQRVNQRIDEGIVIKDATSKSGAVFIFDSVRNYYPAKTGTRIFSSVP